MSYNERLLFYLLRIGLETESEYDFEFTEKPNWKFIFDMSSEQGVLAIVFDGLEFLMKNNLISEEYLPSRSVRMQWGMNVMKIEDVYERQYALANELANIYAENGIKTVVLKGIACSVTYPKPNHRPCGDLDCFLMGDYERGNNIAVKNGGKFEGNDTKHAHINYKGLEIENHQFCTCVCGAKKRKDFERYIQKILNEDGLTKIGETNLLSPVPLFNALFLTEHSWRHFLGEEAKLRHICDWAMLLKHHNDDIDWKCFEEICNKRDKNLIRFARCVSVTCKEYIGTQTPYIFADSSENDELSKHLLHSVLYDKDPEHIPGKKYFFKRRYVVVKRLLKNNWRIKEFSEDSALYRTASFLWEHMFERHPHL